jgi:hypothetical protein
MKVSELIEALKDLPPDLEVVMSKDAEGNGFSPLDGIDDDSVYIPESTYHGDVYSITDVEDNPEDYGFEDDEWEDVKKTRPCVVLWPTN